MNHPSPPSFASSPLVIGGVGGSGTRVVAQLAQAMNIQIGESLNPALDNQWFGVLFNRPEWASTAPEKDVLQALELFTRASLEGLRSNASPSDVALINHSLSTWRPGQRNPDLAMHTKNAFLQSNGLGKDIHEKWGWKQPNSHIFIPQIAKFFQNAKYILVVRNGLDMAFSHNHLQLRVWGRRFGIDAGFTTSVTPTQSLQYWLAANALARRNLQTLMPGRWLEIHFESLIANPLKEIRKMADFADVSCDATTLRKMSAFIQTPSSINRFRDHSLTAFEPQQIEAVRALGFNVE
jgi:hypothetical protein